MPGGPFDFLNFIESFRDCADEVLKNFVRSGKLRHLKSKKAPNQAGYWGKG
jgi:hypothetical protein